ncbi:MAG TPA: hypothetical protein VJ464_17375 [Blastocatellia bacterium]|nr:hypothetical protein [Blastocatellia bacterium]
MMNFNPHRLLRPLALMSALVFLMVGILSSFTLAVKAATGDLDPTFGTGGKIVITAPQGPKALRAIAIQRDGKVIVAGWGANPPPQTFTDVALARYNPDGSLDQTFGTGGYILNPFSYDPDEVYAIGIQSNGKIVIGGKTSNSMGKPFWLLARYTADGHLDTTFGLNGIIRGPDDSVIYNLAILPDDRIVTVGSAYQFSYLPSGTYLTRFNADGGHDSSFNGNGYVLTPYGLFGYPGTALAVQPDGKIIIGGGSSFTMMRYNTDGSVDMNFGTGGVATASFAKPYAVITALGLQSDGRIVAAGYAGDVNGPFDFALTRFKYNGAVDKSFNGGKVTTDFSGEDDAARALIIQPDGRPVAVGYASHQGNYDFALARYNWDGSLDSTFGSGGKVTTDFAGGNDQAYAAALQSDGKIIAAGNASNPFLKGALARYSGDGFDLTLQDEGNGNILQINSATGQYVFKNCAGTVLGGTGTVTRRGAIITLQHNGGDRKVQATVDANTHRANATIKIIGGGPAYTIIDRDITNNTGTCP